MEMHQIRYFLSLAETLNFTRAAEKCNVTQPALTRAIQALEGELGGDLVLREGRLSRLTDLGVRMLPLLRQCYDSAISAKAIAQSIQTGGPRSLSLALSRTVDLRLLGAILSELFRAYPSLRLQVRRGSGEQIVEFLKKGDAEIAVAGAPTCEWERIDVWPIFSESFEIVMNPDHRLATRGSADISLSDLLEETFLLQNECEADEAETRQFEAAGVCMDRAHRVESDGDLAALVEANMGVALAPRSALRSQDFIRFVTVNVDLRRTVMLYTVAGRSRSPEAAAFISQLRASEWPAAGERPI
jgi:DNA-binding transcriptional LysR family regulator